MDYQECDLGSVSENRIWLLIYDRFDRHWDLGSSFETTLIVGMEHTNPWWIGN